MARIVPGICSLQQHQRSLACEPERYRPERCPHCGRARPWRHGCYARKADRGGGERSLNPVAIPRFFCPHCRRSGSRLPECLSPRRWYEWAVQQRMLARVWAGASLRAAAGEGPASRRTLGRWWGWLVERYPKHSFHLRSLAPGLGRHQGLRAFWPAALRRQGFGAWMASLDALGVVVP